MGTQLAQVGVDPEIDPRVERIIWRALGHKTVRQIAEEAGLEPEEVLRIKKRMFEELDVLTIEQRRMKIMVHFEEVVSNAMKWANETSDDRNKSGLLNTAINASKEILRQLKAIDAGENEAITQLNNLRIREILRLMDRVVASGVREIAETYELDEAELSEIFTQKLVIEAENVDSEIMN